MAKAMTFRLADDKAQELEAIARADETPVNRVAVEAIDKLIEERRNDAAFQERLRRHMDENKRVLERLAG